MGEPLTREERTDIALRARAGVFPTNLRPAFTRYEATVQAVEAERDALRHGVRNALATLDGHTCHEGHTDSDHLRLYRAVVGEIDRLVSPDPDE